LKFDYLFIGTNFYKSQNQIGFLVPFMCGIGTGIDIFERKKEKKKD
jgi:hypothetical protein